MLVFAIGKQVTLQNEQDLYTIAKKKYELQDSDGFTCNKQYMFHNLTNMRKELYMKEKNKRADKIIEFNGGDNFRVEETKHNEIEKKSTGGSPKIKILGRYRIVHCF